MESGPSLQRRATSRSRVSSPSAAKTGTAPTSPALATLRCRDMTRDVLRLFGPAAVVHPEGLRPAFARKSVEARRSEERRVGKECSARRSTQHQKKRET